MSKIPVGDGWAYPDATEQDTAGVLLDSSRTIHYSPTGTNTFNGLSPEKAKQDIQVCLDATTTDLVPPADTNNLATVLEAQGGTFVGDLVLPDGVSLEGPLSALVTTGLVGIEVGSSLSCNPRAIISNTDNATAVSINGKSQLGVDARSMSLGGNNQTGVLIQGTNSAIFVSCSETRVLGTGSTVFKYIGESTIDSDLNYNTVILDGNNNTFLDFDPSDPLDTLDVNVSSVHSGSLATGTAGVIARGGIVKVRAGSIAAEMVANTLVGSVLSISANVLGGNTLSAGSVIYDTVGVILGDLETTATGNILVRSSSITGTATNAGSMSIICTEFDGEIVNTGNMYVIIGNYNGTLPADDSSIDGIINGVRYGTWADKGYILATWGANLQNPGRFAAINGAANETEVAGLGVMASAQVPADGTIDVVNYYSATGDNTTVFKIIKNGLLAYTFTCDAAYGMETGIGVPVAAGDNVALEYDAGTAPSNGIYTMYVN